MDRQAIKERVRIWLDEYTPTDQGISIPIDAYIDPMLTESVTEILTKAPIERLDPQSITPESVSLQDGVVTVTAKKDSMARPVSVKIVDWIRSVTSFAPIGSPIENMQHNMFVRGTIHRPVATIEDKNSRIIIRCYSTAQPTVNNDDIDLNGIKMISAEDFREDLLRSLIILTAAKVALASEQPDVYSALYQQYQISMQ